MLQISPHGPFNEFLIHQFNLDKIGGPLDGKFKYLLSRLVDEINQC